jgi:hypothetical protein
MWEPRHLTTLWVSTAFYRYSWPIYSLLYCPCLTHYLSLLPFTILCTVSQTTIQFGKVKLSLCLTNQALHHEDVQGSGCRDPRFPDLGTSWRWCVEFFKFYIGFSEGCFDCTYIQAQMAMDTKAPANPLTHSFTHLSWSLLEKKS